jgi:hypothetical protein
VAFGTQGRQEEQAPQGGIADFGEAGMTTQGTGLPQPGIKRGKGDEIGSLLKGQDSQDFGEKGGCRQVTNAGISPTSQFALAGFSVDFSPNF